MTDIGIILLAAGASRRMGKAKQLLKINAKHTLIEHSILAAQNTSCTSLLVVLGATATAIQRAISNLKVTYVINENWEQGMGSSLQVGLQALLQQKPKLQAVLISVCDQPYLTTTLLEQLIITYQTTSYPIVCSNYGNRLGVPAIFDQQFFPQLLALQADEGARKLLRNKASKLTTINFLKGAIDLDTPAAYQAYLHSLDFVNRPK